MFRWVIILSLAACSVGKTAPPDDGEATFRDVCARCHGTQGTGGVPITPNGPRPRDLTDPAWHLTVTDDQIEATIMTGKDPMPSFRDVLTKQQIKAVAGKIRRLNRNRKAAQ